MAAKKSTTSKPAFQFEKSLDELEKLVEKMEQGDIGLEESLQYFEKGVQLTQACQKALQDAEQKVTILLEKNAKLEAEKFEPEA